jgi:hypothetical protein
MDLNNRKKVSKIFLVVFFIWAIVILVGKKIENNENLMYNFHGPVKKIRYNVQGFAHVTIDGKEYDLRITDWNSNIKIFKDDTLIKEKGDSKVKLIRKNSKDTIY